MFIKDHSSKKLAAMLALCFVVACSSHKKENTDINSDDTSADIVLNDDSTSTEASETEVSAETETASTSTDDSVTETTSADTTSTDETADRQTTTTTTVTSTQPTELQNTPFEKDGYTLNAYYFVQNGQEDFSSLSKKIYGRPDRAQLIQKWNHKKLKAGQVIYYNSPFRHSDSSQMLSFAEDFGYSNEKLIVKKGDTLSKLAQSMYGDIGAWRILASMNPSLTSPDSLEVGQSLVYQPQIDTEAKLQEFIAKASTNNSSAETEQKDQAAQVAPTEQANVDMSAAAPTTEDSGSKVQEPGLEEEIAEGSAPTTPEESPKPFWKKLPNKDLQFYGAMGIIVLALLYLVIRRRNSKA
jgi:hypothetical protein